jgi:hypothetical protein
MSIKLLTPYRRKGFWIFRRRVPLRYAGFDNRKIVRITTHIRIADDPHAIRAAPIVQQLNHIGVRIKGASTWQRIKKLWRAYYVLDQLRRWTSFTSAKAMAVFCLPV